jgi:hypothetical protein
MSGASETARNVGRTLSHAFGGVGNYTTAGELLTGVQIGTSCFDRPVPMLYGRNRIAGNLIWMPQSFWEKVAGESASGGGKGGNSPSSGTPDAYYQGFAIGLCEGPVGDILRVWRDKEQFGGLDKLDGGVFTYFHGTRPQTPWTYFDSTPVAKSTEEFVAENGYRIEDPGLDHITSPTSLIPPASIRIKYGGVWKYLLNSSQVSAGYRTGQLYRPNQDILGYPANPNPYYYTIVKVGSGASAYWEVTFSDASLLGCPVIITYSGTRNYSGYAIGYSGTAYLITPRMSLGSSNSMKNYTFEVSGFLDENTDVGGADPAAVVFDMLTNAIYGCGWDASRIEVDLGPDGTVASGYRRYCDQMGFKVSPALNEQKAALDYVQSILDSTNSAMTWSNGKLRVVPLGDVTVGTFTPALQPVYDIVIDNMSALTGSDGSVASIDDGPVTVMRKRQSDTYNRIPVEYLDQANEYNVAVVSEVDQADVDATGSVREAQAVRLACITNQRHAQIISRLMAQRSCYVRNRFKIRVGFKHAVLEPLDIITITEPRLGLDRKPVRITSVDEDPVAQDITIEAEEMPIGIAQAARFATEVGEGGGQDYGTKPYFSNTPIIFAPPPTATESGGPEVWIGTSGANKDWGGSQVWLSWDGITYVYEGDIGAATYGTTVGAVNAGSPFDSVNNVDVDLSVSAGQLASVTDVERDALASDCWLEGEVIAYRDATLQVDGSYRLSSLRRGCRGTASSSHPAGAPFIRIDDNLMKLQVDPTRYGQTIYVKLVSFNLSKTQYDDISDVPVYQYTLPSFALSGAEQILNLPVKFAFDQLVLEDWDIVGSGVVCLASGGLDGSRVLQVTGQAVMIHKGLIPVDALRPIRIASLWKQETQPTNGTGTFRVGFCGIGADMTTKVSMTGADTLSEQYVTDAFESPNASWYSSESFLSGRGSPGGTAAGTVNAPGKFHEDVRYVRLMLIMNGDVGESPAGDGTVSVDNLAALDATADVAKAGNAVRNRTLYGVAVNRVMAAAAGEWDGVPLAAGDLWFDSDQNYVPWRWSGSQWLTVADASPVIASRLAAGIITADKIDAGAVTADKLAADAIKTTGYTFTGTEGGTNEVATSGAKMQRSGTALLAAANSFKVGAVPFSDMALARAFARVDVGASSFSPIYVKGFSSITRVAGPPACLWFQVETEVFSGVQPIPALSVGTCPEEDVGTDADLIAQIQPFIVGYDRNYNYGSGSYYPPGSYHDYGWLGIYVALRRATPGVVGGVPTVEYSWVDPEAFGTGNAVTLYVALITNN